MASAPPLVRESAVPWRERVRRVTEACRRLGASRAWVIGSAARGTAAAESDLDVVVELETAAPFIDRIADFRRELGYSFPYDVLVYRPRELAGLLDAGQPFLQDAMTEARIIWVDGEASLDLGWLDRLTEPDPALNGASLQGFDATEDGGVFDAGGIAQHWLAQAVEDVDTARTLQAAAKYAAACFHAQQAGEKAMKAYLIRSGDRRVPEHNVGTLVTRAQVRDRRFGPLVGDGAFLDRYYIATRYPDAWPGGAFPASRYFERDGVDAIAAAERLVDAAREGMTELDGRAA